MVFFKQLILILILSSEHFILVENDLCPFRPFIVNGVRLVHEQFLLQFKRKLRFVSIFQLFEHNFEVEGIQFLNLRGIIEI